MRTFALNVPAPLSGGGSSSTSSGGDRQGHPALGRAADLGGVDEAQATPTLGLDHDPVEDVLAVVVDHLVDRADLVPSAA